MKITVRQVKNHGTRAWLLDYTKPGEKRHRQFFNSKAKAEAEAAQVKTQLATLGTAWLDFPVAARSEVAAVWDEVKAAGLSLRHVWDVYRRSLGRSEIVVESLGAARDAFLREKAAARLSPRSLAALKSNLGRFVAGRQSVAVQDVTREDVLGWLSRPEWGPRTFNSYRLTLATFFKWCLRRRFAAASPVASIDPISPRRMPDLDEAPGILTIHQCARLLCATLDTDADLVPYVALCLFAGLRPEREAARMEAGDIRDGLIAVRGLNAKDRQRRLVPVHPTLKAWLDLGGELPVKNLRRRFERVRAEAGLIRLDEVEGHTRPQIVSTGWSHDCLRHTFASNYLPVFGPEKTIAAMGHGDYEMLFSHYRALISPESAGQFWERLRLDAVRSTAGLPQPETHAAVPPAAR